MIDWPLLTLVPTGTSLTSKRYILPLLEKIIKESIVLVRITAWVISSWVFTPLPFRFWVRKLVAGILLTRPPSVIITTHFSGSTNSISFSSLVEATWVIVLRRASPYVFFKALNPSIISGIGFTRIAFKRANSVSNSDFSFSISTFSNFANLESFISRIAFAWISEKPYWLIRAVLAAAADSLFLIRAIMLSISSRALNRPSKIWIRAVILSASCFVFLNRTSFWWAI